MKPQKLFCDKPEFFIADLLFSCYTNLKAYISNFLGLRAVRSSIAFQKIYAFSTNHMKKAGDFQRGASCDKKGRKTIEEKSIKEVQGQIILHDF